MQRPSEKDLFPRPCDGAVVETNSPAFVWLPVKDAAFYVLSIQGADGDEMFSMVQKDNATCAPATALPA